MFNYIFDSSNYYLNFYAIPHTVIGLLILFEGIFIYVQNRRSLTNLAYLINCFFPAIWLTGAGLILSSGEKNLSLFWARSYCYLGIIFIPAAVYLFSLVWKNSLINSLAFNRASKIYELFLKKKSLFFIFSLSLIFYFFSLFSNKFLIGAWSYPWGFYPKGGLFLLVFILWFIIIYLLALGNFILAYKKAPSLLKKKQARLIIIAFSVAIIGAFEFLPNYGVQLYLFASIPTFIFVSVVGYCVIRYKLMDIETILHKTVAWFFTNLILVVPFVLILYLTYPWYSQLSNIGFLIFLGFLGIIFLFFVKAFHSRIDHFFQRRRYSLEEIANQFTEDLVHLKGIVALSRRIKDVIKSTLYSQKVDFFVYDSEKDKYLPINNTDNSKLQIKNTFLQWLTESNKIIYKDLAEIDPFYAQVKADLKNYFDFTNSVVIIPLILGQELLGIINLSKKVTYKRYTALDFHFLSVLKNQSAIAISNSLLYDNMEDQVKKRTDELVDTQKQLIRAEKMATVGTLAGGVAHEINNPLTAILTNVQFLLSDPGSVDQESLELMEEATKRCRTIVQKLMLYARKPTESDQMQNVDILKIMQGIIGLLSYQFKQENLKIEIKAGQNDYLVVGNQNEIEQVITNLILNAKDAIKKVKTEGNIEIILSSDDSSVVIKVKDEGIGISDKNISKIFDPFFTTKDVGKGTGLGLSICQSIIQKHQGSIEVESKKDCGSTFIVMLPKATANKQ